MNNDGGFENWTRDAIDRLEAGRLELKSSLDAVCAYLDQQLAPLKALAGERAGTAAAQQVRIECLRAAIGVSTNPLAGKPRGDDIARMARVFENYMDGQTPPAEPVVTLVSE